MRLRQLVERRVSSAASGESLRPLSPQEVEKIAGAIYFVITPHGPFPGMPGPGHGPFPFPIPYLP